MSSICSSCKKNPVTPGKYCNSCRIRQNRNAFVRKLRALLHYGDACYCCGEDRLALLTIDHINGGGNKHRDEIKSNIYNWLIRNNYPEGFAIACNNCNSGANIAKGSCPHGI